MTLLVVAIAALLVAAAIGLLVLHVSPTVIISIGVATSVFSGFSKHMGLPIPPDRLIMGLGFFLLLVGTERKHLAMRVRFRSEHAVMLVLGAYAIVSSLAVGSLFGPEQGFYGVLDRLAVTGFVLFTVAPLLFPDKKSRNVFLVVMVCLGAYLGVTALLEGFGAKSLTWPAYIHDPAVGIHFDRARGPMGEAAGFGSGAVRVRGRRGGGRPELDGPVVQEPRVAGGGGLPAGNALHPHPIRLAREHPRRVGGLGGRAASGAGGSCLRSPSAGSWFSVSSPSPRR